MKTIDDPRLEKDKSFKQLIIKNTRLYFSTIQRDWNDLSLLEMIGILSNVDTVSGIANILNVPSLVIYIVGIKKNYDKKSFTSPRRTKSSARAFVFAH